MFDSMVIKKIFVLVDLLRVLFLKIEYNKLCDFYYIWRYWMLLYKGKCDKKNFLKFDFIDMII